MVTPEFTGDYGTSDPERSPVMHLEPPSPDLIVLPKNRSMGNLMLHSKSSTTAFGPPARHRYSVDAGTNAELDSMLKTPILPEHEHGLGLSGLRRIRQQPPPVRNEGTSTRSGSMTLSLPPSRHPSTSLPSGPASPTFTFGEDLSRFPSESLHSFSFAHQSEDFIHNRQNVLKRSIDFMRDKLGWAATGPHIANAQAKVSGDSEVQSVMELLSRANLIGLEAPQAHGQGLAQGPLTGPAGLSGENIFEKSFLPIRSESPTSVDEPESPKASKAAKDALIAADVLPRAPILDYESAIIEDSGLEMPSRVKSNDTVTSVPTEESKTKPQAIRRASLKRTYTDIQPLALQNRLTDALAQPYLATGEGSLNDSSIISPKSIPTFAPAATGPAPHGHGNRMAPAAQAIFTTEAHAPWTITAANDLACLVFGVTRAEVRKIGIMEVVRDERRKWLEEKLRDPDAEPTKAEQQANGTKQEQAASKNSNLAAMGNGVTARLLSKAPSRVAQQKKQRAKTDDGVGSSFSQKKDPAKAGLTNHPHHKSRGVILCGDVVPIQKRNGAIGSASLWVKEKRGGLIWVLEEIHEDVAYISVDEVGCVTKVTGDIAAIWGGERVRGGMDLARLIPDIPRRKGTNTGALDLDMIADTRRYTARMSNGINIPATVDQLSGQQTFRVSSFPHIAGIIVLSSTTLNITSSNSAFTGALFGQGHPDGQHITELIPAFDKILSLMIDEDNIRLVDGIVIPEHSFRKARALLALREGKGDAAALFLRPQGLPARHRDGADIMVDVQMRVVRSEKAGPKIEESVIVEDDEDPQPLQATMTPTSEVVYALWITYSRQLHAANSSKGGPVTQVVSQPPSPPRQPSPGQPLTFQTSEPVGNASNGNARSDNPSISLLTQRIQEAVSQSITEPPQSVLATVEQEKKLESSEPAKKKMIDDFVILEEMGQGAYGQVKLCRYKKNPSKKMVIKYVTKRRILVDTWTRDRRLGTVPLEIHVLDYLRRDGLKHPNIVEMEDFFEDSVNYYIEMVPHGLPGMDLFDYIELRVNMDEAECKKIFVQVANALHHLHTKAKVVHRDIKDENVILDGEGNIKLIDFGSAAYIKNGPFDVFVGTIDYAAPEVLAGQSYRGKEQDVWALGILLYTIVYKENPFYSIDEIMDHDLRVPYILSEECIHLIRHMLNRTVDERMTISQVLEHPWCRNVPGIQSTFEPIEG